MKKLELNATTLGLIVDFVILLGGLCLAITRIYEFFAKPTSKIKTKKDAQLKEKIVAVLDEELPARFEQHDLEVRGKYLSDRYKYLKEIKDAVLLDVDDTISTVKTDNIAQNAMMHALVQSSKDVLRQRIMAIYHAYKKERRLPQYEWEALQELYKDYKAEKGNSYIDKYYGRMCEWERYDDEDYE